MSRCPNNRPRMSSPTPWPTSQPWLSVITGIEFMQRGPCQGSHLQHPKHLSLHAASCLAHYSYVRLWQKQSGLRHLHPRFQSGLRHLHPRCQSGLRHLHPRFFCRSISAFAAWRCELSICLNSAAPNSWPDASVCRTRKRFKLSGPRQM